MKRRIVSLLLVLAMVLCLAACGGDADRIAELEAENEALKAQVEALTAQLDSAANPVGLTEWHFDAHAWSGNNGANITFTGTPESYAEGQTAALKITLEGEQVDSIDCQWDGTVYTATTDLNAADGYCYYCVITDPYGNASEVELNTPKNPTNEALINIETALTSYCGMMVEDSKLEGNTLTITAGYAQVQLPLIGKSDAQVTITGAELILEAEGQEIDRATLSMQQGDTATGYSAEVIGITFTVPAMEDDQQLELRMEVTLSDGQILTTRGGNWFANGGDLFLVVG